MVESHLEVREQLAEASDIEAQPACWTWERAAGAAETREHSFQEATSSDTSQASVLQC